MKAAAPFTKAEMGEELREILFIQASQIDHAGREGAASSFLGFQYEFSPGTTPEQSDFAQVDLPSFSAWSYLSTAYDYAFQVGQCWGYGESDNHDVIAFHHGVTPAACYGNGSPYLDKDSKCRHVVDLAVGRWNLEAEDGREVTVRQLALLANMSEAAVRNSLSAEKIRTPIQVDVAKGWLRARKGFVPTRTEENRDAFWVAHTRALLNSSPAGAALGAILTDLKLTPEMAARNANVGTDLVRDVIEENHSAADVDGLRKLGAALRLDVPHFVGRVIEAALRREEARQGAKS